MQTFEELSDIFSDHNNYLTSRELLMRVSSNFKELMNENIKILKNDFPENILLFAGYNLEDQSYFLFALQEGTSKFASLENGAKEHQKRTHKRLQLQKEMVRLTESFRNKWIFTKGAKMELYHFKHHIPPMQCTVKRILASAQ